MPVWEWILIVAVVIAVAIGLVAWISANKRKRTQRLQQRFGPEYERTVSETGEQRAAEKELAARERKRDKLDIRPLSSAALETFSGRWRAVQTAFVDSPSSALGDADRLVTEVMRERGYPVDDFDQRASDISVDHPTVVEDYRAAHDIFELQHHGAVGTEEQRQAFVHYRGLFAKLLDPGDGRKPPQDNNTTQEASS